MSATVQHPRERPILFSGEMVRAILAGNKTQTRRVITGKTKRGQALLQWLDDAGFDPALVADPENGWSPYGYAGERLWVRETWAPADWMAGADCDRDPPQFVAYRADNTARGWNGDLQPFDADTSGWNWDKFAGKWKPSIFIPRWASRITLEITDVRVQRVQEIDGYDATAEGITIPRCGCEVCRHSAQMCPADQGAAIMEYAALWDRINGKRPGCPWDANPWLWAISFRRVEG